MTIGARESRHSKQGKILAWTAIVIVALYASLIMAPPLPRPMGVGLDASWSLGLNMAHAKHFTPGRDYIFSYGPLGYVVWPDPASESPAPVLAYHVTLYAMRLLAVWSILLSVRPRRLALALVTIFAAAYVLDFRVLDNAVITVVALLLLPLARRTRWRYIELALAAFVAGLATMVKLDQGIEATLLFFCVATVVFYRDWPLTRTAKSQAVAACCVLPVTAIAAYWSATGGLSGFGRYIYLGLDIVSGYADAMELVGPVLETTVILAVMGLIVIGIPVVAVNRRALWAGYAPAVLAAFFAMKHSLVRQEPIHSNLFWVHAATALLFLLVCASNWRDRLLMVVLQLFVMGIGAVLVIDNFPGFEESVIGRLSISPPLTTDLSALLDWSNTWKRFVTQQAGARRTLRLDGRFDIVDGRRTVTAIPWNIDRVKAQRWNWKPIGTIQLYSAYTPRLDRFSAKRFEAANAPEQAVIEFQWVDIDGRHPFFSEPASWRAVLDRYDAKIKGPGLFLAGRRTEPRFGAPILIRSGTVTWGQEISVPRVDGVLLITAEIKTNLLGRAATALVRGTPVFIGTKFENGQAIWWRTVPSNLVTGAVVQPLPKTFEDLYSLFFLGHTPVRHSRVETIAFLNHEPWRFQDTIRIHWSYLPTRIQDVTVNAYPVPANQLTTLWKPGDSAPRGLNASVVPGVSSIQVIQAGVHPQVTFKIPDLGQFQTVVVRARFQTAAEIAASFGTGADGRGITGAVPDTNRWFDIYLNLGQNRFWESEHGTVLRLETPASIGPNTTTEIAGIWGTNIAAGSARPEIEFFDTAAPARDSNTAGHPVSAHFTSVENVEGSVDGCDAKHIFGWVWDKTRPNDPIVVEIRDGNTVLTRMYASEFRQDLLAAGKGNGSHAFVYSLPPDNSNRGERKIRVFASGTNAEIWGSPKIIKTKHR